MAFEVNCTKRLNTYFCPSICQYTYLVYSSKNLEFISIISFDTTMKRVERECLLMPKQISIDFLSNTHTIVETKGWFQYQREKGRDRKYYKCCVILQDRNNTVADCKMGRHRTSNKSSEQTMIVMIKLKIKQQRLYFRLL